MEIFHEVEGIDPDAPKKENIRIGMNPVEGEGVVMKSADEGPVRINHSEEAVTEEAVTDEAPAEYEAATEESDRDENAGTVEVMTDID